MQTGKVINVLAISAVVVIVAGAVWLKSQRAQEAPAQPATTPVAPTATATAPAVPVEAVPTTSPAVTTTQETAATDALLPRLVDLGADKCIPCKKLAPILEELRKEYAGRLSVEFIDVWKNPAAKEPYNIRLIPTQVLYDALGREVWRHEGFISKEDLKAVFAEKAGVK